MLSLPEVYVVFGPFISISQSMYYFFSSVQSSVCTATVWRKETVTLKVMSIYTVSVMLRYCAPCNLMFHGWVFNIHPRVEWAIAISWPPVCLKSLGVS